jgi:hypothetical protein
MRLSWSFRLVTACLVVVLLPTSGSVLLPRGEQAALAASAGPPHSPDAPSALLYDQTNNPSPSGWTTSSNYGSALSRFSSQAGDDFVVPSDIFWHITTVTFVGNYDGPTGSGVDSLLVQFYRDSGGGLPGNLIIGPTIPGGSIGGLDSGVFVVTISPALILGPGHFWVSAQANKACPGESCRQWVWDERTVKANSESVWQQPGNGYGSGCITWQPRITVCNQPNGSTNPDLLFKLEGTTAAVSARIFLPVIRR